MYNPNDEPDILGEHSETQQEELFREAQTDMNSLSEDEFQYRYKTTKYNYNLLLSTWQKLREISNALEEIGTTLNIDSEVKENTQYLIDDYTHLLEQMQMASYWEQEGQHT